MATATQRSAPAELMFKNGDTVVWRKHVTLPVLNARRNTREKMGEGPFRLGDLNLPNATATINTADGKMACITLSWVEPDGSDPA